MADDVQYQVVFITREHVTLSKQPFTNFYILGLEFENRLEPEDEEVKNTIGRRISIPTRYQGKIFLISVASILTFGTSFEHVRDVLDEHSRTMTRKFLIPKNELNLNYSFNGGQAFRWQQSGNDSWIGVFAHRVWTLWREGDHISYDVVRSPSVAETEDDELVLKEYLRADESLSDLYQHWAACDPIFDKAAKKFEGIRILRQDPVETIFSFICSSNNNIPRIKSMVEKMCSLYGDQIAVVGGVAYYDFPAIDRLADAKVQSALAEAKFGYRAKFIQQTASKMLELGGLDWVSRLRELPYKEAKLELIQLPGVGAKVADCICLMSLNHLDAIPVDVHVFQIATKYYLPHLKNMKSVTDRVYNEIGDHFRSLYGKYAGWSHSVLFCADLRAFKEPLDTNKKRGRTRNGEDSCKKSKKLRK